MVGLPMMVVVSACMGTVIHVHIIRSVMLRGMILSVISRHQMMSIVMAVGGHTLGPTTIIVRITGTGHIIV
jgi:hypothetical protein